MDFQPRDLVPTAQHADEWRGEHVVVSTVWDSPDGTGHDINVGIASDDEIKHRHGYTDGFSHDDLELMR
ncbi:hypothetical protein CWO91_26655 [Bradyrhizobium genosp. SA-3]|uniref:hypothetical protein n=1 Tax=Bradyrhizobium genosp. SA-3 TaxID=508868 RepID=UPI00102A151F|nr:hypothetical protein [Bradyrhizobium genosp. SA-3]RZN07582.1 hypothetical protein CWO91_26655 [Bradyrhizobium genosp. SA-3]